MKLKHSARVPLLIIFQPAGIFIESGQIEYCLSAFTNTRNWAVVSSKGVLIYSTETRMIISLHANHIRTERECEMQQRALTRWPNRLKCLKQLAINMSTKITLETP